MAAVALVSWATVRGPGLSPDSLVYALLARSLARFDGFRRFGTAASHFPPGYPTLLALIGAVDPASLLQPRRP